jgi:hypothetical protein
MSGGPRTLCGRGDGDEESSDLGRWFTGSGWRQQSHPATGLGIRAGPGGRRVPFAAAIRTGRKAGRRHSWRLQDEPRRLTHATLGWSSTKSATPPFEPKATTLFSPLSLQERASLPLRELPPALQVMYLGGSSTPTLGRASFLHQAEIANAARSALSDEPTAHHSRLHQGGPNCSDGRHRCGGSQRSARRVHVRDSIGLSNAIQIVA